MSNELDQARIVNGLSQATVEVFTTMLGMELVAQPAYRQGGKPEPTNGVVTLIGLAGKWVGTGSIWCVPEMARKISGQLLMSEFANVDQEVLDAMGEVTNMIIGNFKNSIEDLVGPLGLSIPVVIFGHNFTASSLHAAEWTVVPFQCPDGKMEIKICLSLQPEPSQNRRYAHLNAQVAV
jgi:chemotaxis protein CheX